MKLTMRTWTGHALGTEVKLMVSTENTSAGEQALRRAVEDLEETEQTLSRFRPQSELSRLNREGTLLASNRLLSTIRAAVYAYEWSEGLLDPRVIESLEGFGYREALPQGDVSRPIPPGPLSLVSMRSWIEYATGRITLPPGVRLDLAGVGKALGIGWAARHLAGHSGLLVDVGGDVVALGHDEQERPWRISVEHEGIVGEFTGSSVAVATSTTTLRAWTAAGRKVHHLIDPRTGWPSESELLFTTVAAPTILEADLAAKLLLIEGKPGLERINETCQIVVTNNQGQTEMLGGREAMEATA